MTARLAIRLPKDLMQRLDALVPDEHHTRSEAVRRAIELYVRRFEAAHDVGQYEKLPLSPDELALVDDIESWSATPEW